MKQSNTKKSLTLSAWALFISILMLIGTTFAWFTDSVTSGKNRITAGNLDVELKHYTTDATAATTVKDKTDLFKVALWEPGVIAYENFIVSNEGNLALKYALNLNVFDKNSYNSHDLTEVIKVAVVEGGFNPTGTTSEAKRVEAQTLSNYDTLADFQKTGNLTAKENEHSSDTYGVVLYWQPTDNDNLYNVNNYTGEIPTSDHQALFVEFGVNLVATQDTVEADSFNNQYDLLAKLPIVAEAEVKNNQDTIIQAKDNVGSILATATVPQAAELPEETKKIMMTIEEAGIPSEVKAELLENEEALNLDVKFFAISSSGTKTQITDFGSQIVTVDLSAQIPEGHELTRVFHTHNGTATEMGKVTSSEAVTDGKYYYNSGTKQLTIGSKTFSPFSFVIQEKPAVAKVVQTGTKYETLQGAIDAATAGQTVELLCNYTLPNATPIQINESLILDLGGFELKGTFANPVVYVTGNGVSLTNGTITATAVAGGWGAVSMNGGQINNITSSVTINSNSRGLYVAAGTVKDLNCIIKANLAGNLAQIGSEAIYIKDGTVEKITSGSYSSHPESFASDAYSQMASPVIYVYSSGTLGSINGGTFQGGATYCIQSYSEFNITGGRFMYPYVDSNDYGKGNAYNPTNYFPNTKPTISGGKFYVGGNSTDSGLTEMNRIMFTKLASGYQLVRAEEVEAFATDTMKYYYWNVVAK